MKRFIYSLEQVKKIRELEKEQVALELERIKQALKQTTDQIESYQNSINDAQNKLRNKEQESGQIQPEYRKMAKVFIAQITENKNAAMQIAKNLEEKYNTVQFELLKKIQAVRMLEKHQHRQQLEYEIEQIRQQHNEADDLWSTRIKA